MLRNQKNLETNVNNLKKLKLTKGVDNEGINEKILLKHTYGSDQKKSSLYATNQKHAVTKQNITGIDNEKNLARASVATFNSGTMRTNTSSGTRGKRNLYFRDPLENNARKAAYSNIEKEEEVHVQRNIMSDFKDRRKSTEKTINEKEYVRNFMK